MWNPFKKRILRFKSLIVDEKYKIVPAFVLGGKQYYQFSNTMDMPAARGLSAMWIFDEFRMKCDKEYLELHIKATEKLLEGTNGIVTLKHLLTIKEINQNLQDRLNLAALPEHCYRLASVHFFDAEESIHIYDQKHNDKKIAEWKKNPDALSFFLTQPLKNYLPFSDLPNTNVETYLKVGEKIAAFGQQKLHGLLSKKE